MSGHIPYFVSAASILAQTSNFCCKETASAMASALKHVGESLSLSQMSSCYRGKNSDKTATGPEWRRLLIALKCRKDECEDYVQ